jgi:hypothetical protein
MHHFVAARADASDLEPCDVGDLHSPINRRIIVNVVSYIAGRSVSRTGGRVATVPRHVQRRGCLNSDNASLNTQNSEPSAGLRYFSTWPEMSNPRLKSRSVIQQLDVARAFARRDALQIGVDVGNLRILHDYFRKHRHAA